MRRTAVSLALLLALAACKDDSPAGSPAASTGNPAGTASRAPREVRPLTPADVERYIEVLPEFAKGNNIPTWTAVAEKHGMTFQELTALTTRVSRAQMNLAIKGGAGKATGVDAQDVEVVRPFADRLREVTARSK